METISFNVKNIFGELLKIEINKSIKIESKKNPTFLILHALGGRKENKTINFIAKKLPNYGFNTVQFDFSGHGESEGNLKDCTISKQLTEIDTVINSLSKYNFLNLNKIILLGNSFSVLTAIAFACKSPLISSLVLISGRANYIRWIDTLEKNDERYYLDEYNYVEQSFIEDYKKYNPLNIIKKLEIPILIIHGEKDELIPVEEANLLFQSINSKNKYLKIINGADHRYSDIKLKEKVFECILNFLKVTF